MCAHGAARARAPRAGAASCSFRYQVACSCAHPGHSRLSQNTWNLYGCSVTGQILMDTATAMKSSGLFAAGYEYVNRRVLETMFLKALFFLLCA